MNHDVVFELEELEALLNFVSAMAKDKQAVWQNPDWPKDCWVKLRDKLREACSQAHAISAGHDAYLGRLNAEDARYGKI